MARRPGPSFRALLFRWRYAQGSRATEDMPRGRRQGAEPFNFQAPKSLKLGEASNKGFKASEGSKWPRKARNEDFRAPESSELWRGLLQSSRILRGDHFFFWKLFFLFFLTPARLGAMYYM